MSSGNVANTDAGETAQFASPVEGLRQELFGFVRRRMPNAAEAEEVVQKTICRAMSRQHLYDSKKGTLSTWLKAIAARQVYDVKRAWKREKNVVELDSLPEKYPLPSGGDPAEKYRKDLARDLLVKRLATLPWPQADILKLRFFEKMPPRKIAEVLKLRVRKVRSEAANGFVELRRLYGVRRKRG